MNLRDLMEQSGARNAMLGEARQIVTFNVDGRTFGIDVGVVREIKGWQMTTPLPHSAQYVRGVINLRGLILAVYDLRARLGAGLTAATAKHVIVVVDVGEQTAGLLVDAVSDIVDVPVTSIHPAPAVAMNGLDVIEGMALLPNEVVALLKLEAVLSDQLTRAAASLAA
ncbi:MAG: chemotaxis protein CheW [Beijerinckiaceae bacterium]